MQDNKCVSITIKGRVQGVGFRYHTQNAANKFEVNGFVKNMQDGSVYIEACGDKRNLEKFIDWCRKGPVLANVRDIVVNETPMQKFSNFKVTY